MAPGFAALLRSGPMGPHRTMRAMPTTLPDGRRLGAHLPLAGGMVRAVERARKIRAQAIQIWTDNPTAWRRRSAPPPEAPAFRERLRTLDIGPVAVHASYLINLAGPEPEFFERSIALLGAELRDGPTFGATFVNVHIGSHRGAGVDDKAGALKTFFNRRRKPAIVNFLSARNHLLLLAKNEQWRNLFIDGWRILPYEIVKLCYIAVFETRALGAYFAFLRLLPRMFRKRRLIMERAQVSATEIRSWFLG